jgi:hypothetical protein
MLRSEFRTLTGKQWDHVFHKHRLQQAGLDFSQFIHALLNIYSGPDGLQSFADN